MESRENPDRIGSANGVLLRASHCSRKSPWRQRRLFNLPASGAFMSSLFAAVEMAPRDPILGLNEAFNADTQPEQGQPRRRRLFRRRRQDPAAGRRQDRRESPPGNPAAARLPAHRGHPRLQQCGAEPAVRQGFRTARRRPRRHLRMPGRHRRAQGRRRLPEAPAARRQGLHQRSELGKPPRPLRRRPASRSRTTPTTMPPRAASISPA